MYNRIPDPPVADGPQSAAAYGLQLLAFVIREQVTCTLSDDQLQLLIHVAPIASAVRTVPEVDYRTVAADAIAAAKRLALGQLQINARLRAELTATQPADASPAGVQPAGGGSLVARRPVVGPLSPTGAAARLSQPAAAVVDWDQVF